MRKVPHTYLRNLEVEQLDVEEMNINKDSGKTHFKMVSNSTIISFLRNKNS